MKQKKLPIILTAGLLAVASLAPVFSSAEGSFVSGDIDMDGTLSIFDMRRMNSCLSGDFTIIKEEAFNSTDMTGDGVIDSLDMCLMRKEIGAMCENITSCMELTELSEGFMDVCENYPDAVITSVEELDSYLSPRIVFDVTEDGVNIDYSTYNVVSDEKKELLLSRYTEEFFEENVLFLNAMYQGYDGELLYEFDDIFYDENVLKIQYHERMVYGDVSAVMTGVLAQITMPKTLYSVNNNVGAEVVWEETETPQEEVFPFTVSETNAVTHSAYKAALSGNAPQVFTSAEELSSWLDGRFASAVVRSLEKTYDEAYFAENVLMLDLYAKEYYGGWMVTPSFSYADDGSFTFFYTRELIEGRTEAGIIITHATVPKSLYYGQDVVSVKEWEEPVDVKYNEFDIQQYYEIYETEILNDSDFIDTWVNSAEELEVFLSEYFTEEGAQLLRDNFFLHDLNEYSAYIWLDTDITGSSHDLLSAYMDSEYGLTLNTGNYQPLSCCGGYFIHVIYTDKAYSDSAVYERYFSFNDDNLHTDGSVIYFSHTFTDEDSSAFNGPYDTLMINQYTFGDETNADIYIAHTGGGPVQYASYTLVGTLELDKDYFPFDEEYTSEYSTDTDWEYLLGASADGGYIFSGEHYIIGYTEAGVYIDYAASENAEKLTLEKILF